MNIQEIIDENLSEMMLLQYSASFHGLQIETGGSKNYISVTNITEALVRIRFLKYILNRDSILLLTSNDPRVRDTAAKFIEYFQNEKENSQTRKQIIKDLTEMSPTTRDQYRPRLRLHLLATSGQEAFLNLYSARFYKAYPGVRAQKDKKHSLTLANIYTIELFRDYVLDRIVNEKYSFKGIKRFANKVKKEYKLK